MDSLVIVDAANVVGSVPDGWWRDRHGAAERLRDALPGLVTDGLPGLVEPPLEMVLVVEGAARAVQSVDGVRVVPAAGSGDDRIVELVAQECRDRDCLVVTADRELRERVQALGARVTGPRAVWGRGGGGHEGRGRQRDDTA
ncbi:NTP pyrophosphohydrolase [Streptomyces lydicus]|uniref:NTP pyrophosphohydrolase n=1 Tax=Streptomyces lydicus TaxID=47763 RepID=UPI0037B86F07